MADFSLKGGENIMKKFLIGVSAGAVMLGSLVAPAFGAPPSYGEQPGFSQASACGSDHGAFGFFGNYGLVDNVHDVDRSDNDDTGYDEYHRQAFPRGKDNT